VTYEVLTFCDPLTSSVCDHTYDTFLIKYNVHANGMFRAGSCGRVTSCPASEMPKNAVRVKKYFGIYWLWAYSNTNIQITNNLISVQSTGRTRSSSLVTLARPSVSSSLQITNGSFT